MGRPSKPLISRENTIEAALKVIDRDGLSGFSLSTVARELNVKSPSLYYHFSDKAALLNEVARALLLNAPEVEDEGLDWTAHIVTLCLTARRSLLRHPHAAPLLLQFFPRKLLLSAYDDVVTKYPIPPALHMAVVEGTEKLTFGSALFEASARSRGVTAMPEFDEEHYPNLTASIQANRFDDEAMFVETIRMFLAGVAARAAQLK